MSLTNAETEVECVETKTFREDKFGSRAWQSMLRKSCSVLSEAVRYHRLRVRVVRVLPSQSESHEWQRLRVEEGGVIKFGTNDDLYREGNNLELWQGSCEAHSQEQVQNSTVEEKPQQWCQLHLCDQEVP